MLTLSAPCAAIAVAIKNGTLAVTEHTGRFGQYWAISDEVGLIEVALSEAEAETRVGAVAKAAA